MTDARRDDKQRRLREFFRRMRQARPATSAEEALEQLTEVLTLVEDEMSGVPNNPDLWQSDGRMYPPRADSRRAVSGHVDVSRYRSRGHNVFIRSNGAIQIRQAHRVPEQGRLFLDKPGADGRKTFDRDDEGGAR